MKITALKKIVTLSMAVAMLSAMTVVGHAAAPVAENTQENIAASTGSTVPVIVDATPLTFKAVVPVSLPVSVDVNGDVTTATNGSIENQSSYGKIRVKGVSVQQTDPYVLNDFSDKATFGAMKVDSSNYAFKLQGFSVKAGGDADMATTEGAAFAEAYPDIAIGADQALKLTYDALMAPQSLGLVNTTVGNVVFTLGWAD